MSGARADLFSSETFGEACLAVSRAARNRDHNNVYYDVAAHACRVFRNESRRMGTAVEKSAYVRATRELAIAHEYRDEYAEALGLYEECIQIRRELFNDDPAPARRRDLAEVLYDKAIGLRYSGDNRSAVEFGTRH